MVKALIYRARGRLLTWLAFGFALGLHLAAVGIAANKSQHLPTSTEPTDAVAVGFDILPEPSANPEEAPASDVAPPSKEEEFVEQLPMPLTSRPRKPMSVRPMPQSVGVARNGANLRSIRAFVLYGPRPVYPYEARRDQITGSGVAIVRVNPLGNAIDVRMKESTGSALLDNATLGALRHWRFKPGVAENVDVPITYTLAGVSY